MTSLSVITINLNNRVGLSQTQASIMAQSRGEGIEWIVVDGGSSDGSVEALNLGRPPDTLIVGEDDGLYDAMNIGLRASGGEWVMFLNSGDRFTQSGVVDEIVEVASSLSGDWLYGRVLRASTVLGFDPFDIEALALGRRVVPHQATVMKRDFLLFLGGFSRDFAIAADQDLLLRAGLSALPLVVPSIWVEMEPGGRGSGRPVSAHLADMRRARVAAGYSVRGPVRDRLSDLEFDVRARLGAGLRRVGIKR